MIRKQWKKRLINGGILTGVFLVAVVFFSYLTNNGNDSMTADMGAATYPQISFSYDGYAFNSVPGYAKEMDIPSIRDTITPVGNQGVEMDIQAHENRVTSVDYKVLSLDGQEVLLEGKVRKPGETQMLDLARKEVLDQERVLQVILHLEGEKDIFYYTRIASAGDKYVSQCLEYVQNFHEAALNDGEGAAISTAIEPNDEGDNTTFSHVTIHSDYDHVTWGELNPQVEGGERWSIKEMRGNYSCVQAEYMVRCQGEVFAPTAQGALEKLSGLAAAVAEMVELDYVNDDRYAETRAHGLLMARKSRRAAAQNLRQKGLNSQQIEQALETVYAPDENGESPELEAAAALVASRYRKKLADGRRDLVVAALQRRGFAYAVIKEAIRRTEEEL